jgi:hypothetical protein
MPKVREEDMTEPLDVHKIMAEHRTHLSSVDGSGRCVVGYPTKTTELCAPDHCLTYRLAEEHEGYPELADLMSDTLRKVANALNGPPPELTSWSWHDLPERAQELVDKVAEQPKPDLTFSWEDLGLDDGGMPIHLPMGVTVDGDGPTSDAEAHHFVCWCGQQCPLDKALRLASTKNAPETEKEFGDRFVRWKLDNGYDKYDVTIDALKEFNQESKSPFEGL